MSETPELQFCHWLKGYLGAITGRDELDAFEANAIRAQLADTLNGSLISPRAVGSAQCTQAQSTDAPLTFADHVENIAASDDNPTKRGRFVRMVRRTGRLNAGTFVEYIDDRGETHLTPPDNVRRLAEPRTPAASEGVTLEDLHYKAELENQQLRAQVEQEIQNWKARNRAACAAEKEVKRLTALVESAAVQLRDVKTILADCSDERVKRSSTFLFLQEAVRWPPHPSTVRQPEEAGK